MDTFSQTDSDLVFRRTTERLVMLGVLVLEGLVFGGVIVAVLTKEPEKLGLVAPLLAVVMAGLSVLTAWIWTYEVRLTPYDFIVKSIFAQKSVPLSNIVGLERRRVKGKNPPQYVLHVKTADQETLKVVDLKLDGKWLHETMREKCRSLKSTEFVD